MLHLNMSSLSFLQSIEQIKMIIEESRKAHGAMLGAGIETDEYIDGELDNYEDDGDY